MARGDQEVVVGVNTNIAYKITDAGITDADVNKPVKISATSLVALCSDGDQIYGFINSVERGTQDGKVVVGIQVDGRRWVTTSGTVAIGEIVEAATNTAAGTALGEDWGIVSTKSAVAADIADDATGAEIATAVNTLLAEALVGSQTKNWVMISGVGTTGLNILIEKI